MLSAFKFNSLVIFEAIETGGVVLTPWADPKDLCTKIKQMKNADWFHKEPECQSELKSDKDYIFSSVFSTRQTYMHVIQYMTLGIAIDSTIAQADNKKLKTQFLVHHSVLYNKYSAQIQTIKSFA